MAVLTGCDRKESEPIEKENTSFFDSPPVTVAELHRNAMGTEPSDFLRSRASDPLHWQPWSPALLEGAKAEQKLIFAVVGSGRFPECAALLDTLRQKPEIIKELHDHYVCSLVDVELHPELALQSAVLSAEIRRRIGFPFLMWMSHEGNPVAWLPLSAADLDDLDEVFENSNAMVSLIWRDSSRYVINNSRRDNEGRQVRQTPVLAEADQTESLKVVAHDALRRLSSLYDPGTGNMDGGGGLVPTSLWRLSATAALSAQTDPSVARRLAGLLEGNTDLLLRSPIHDPLDGGFFSARRSSGWEIPVFMKTADTQVQVALALARSSALLDSARHLNVAQEVLEFAGRHFGPDGAGLGSYDANLPEELESLVYLWSQDALREFLTAEEFAVASAAYGISSLGNIPPESDPKRQFFRKNSLGAKRSAAEVAEDLGRDPAEVQGLLDAVRKRLLAQREEALGRGNSSFMERSRVTATNARYVTALAEIAAITGDPAMLERARNMLADIETKHRTPDGRLLRLAQADDRRMIPARAEDYAALVDAQLALYRVDLDLAHLTAARNLVSALLADHLNPDGFIIEPPLTKRVGELSIISNSMVFGDSTWGALFGALTRIRQLTGDAEIAKVSDTILRSMLHQLDRGSAAGDLILSDFLTNAQIAMADTVVFLDGEPGTAEFDALHEVLRQPKYWSVTLMHIGDGLPEGIPGPAPTGASAAHVKTAEQPLLRASNPAELEQLLQEALRRD